MSSVLSRVSLAVLVLVLVLVAVAVTVPGARAGTYDVPACDAAGGVNNSWRAVSNNQGFSTAYTDCPAGVDPNRGMVARNVVVANTGAGGPLYSRMEFDAPAGTSIVGMTASYDFFRTDHRWETALSNGSTALRGCGIGGVDGCNLGGVNDWIAAPAGSTILYADVYCVDTGCPLSSTDASHNYLAARARITSAAVRLEDDSPPTINAVGGGLWTDGWKSGAESLTVDASDNSGIRRTVVLVNGQQQAKNERACDATLTVPCPNGTDTFSVGTQTLPDGTYPLTVRAVDSAENSTDESRTILVDNTPPGPPQGLAVDGGEGWQPKDAFTLHWVNPSIGLAPMAGVNWQLCPAAGAQNCVSGTKDGNSVATLNDLPVPKDGDWVLNLWLRDAAGNNTPNNGVREHLRADTVAPTAVFSPIDPSDPTRVAIQASDDTSGVASGSIDYKPASATEWTSVPAKVEGGQLVANLPDEVMGDGVYELRGVAVDRAGNEKSTTTLADGTPMTVTLPLRTPTHLAGGRLQTRRRHGKRVRYLATRVRLAYATRTRLQGRLADKDNNSMAGTPLAISQLVDGANPSTGWQTLRTITTSRNGTFSLRTPKRGPSRTIRIRYEGTPTVRPAQFDVHLAVRASSTIHASKHTVRRCHATRFAGTLRGGYVPAGKSLQLQSVVRGRWQTFANPRAKSNGAWNFIYKWTGGPGRYTIRVRIPSDPAYPFATGDSSSTIINVHTKPGSLKKCSSH